ncbi:hypothetical protein FIBSPDRAFT_941534 [Athelia psychrophila]|uniref:Uncharacterized protein n=1 Tax=Athelia psychrophila TaxID=1759441 RepID=A0A167TYX9_9AGAM|nr:hypothetical protein FIBSPDRAFT_941534 [Fibularhizoctonia sp. CBS 109695]
MVKCLNCKIKKPRDGFERSFVDAERGSSDGFGALNLGWHKWASERCISESACTTQKLVLTGLEHVIVGCQWLENSRSSGSESASGMISCKANDQCGLEAVLSARNRRDVGRWAVTGDIVTTKVTLKKAWDVLSTDIGRCLTFTATTTTTTTPQPQHKKQEICRVIVTTKVTLYGSDSELLSLPPGRLNVECGTSEQPIMNHELDSEGSIGLGLHVDSENHLLSLLIFLPSSPVVLLHSIVDTLKGARNLTKWTSNYSNRVNSYHVPLVTPGTLIDSDDGILMGYALSQTRVAVTLTAQRLRPLEADKGDDPEMSNRNNIVSILVLSRSIDSEGLQHYAWEWLTYVNPLALSHWPFADPLQTATFSHPTPFKYFAACSLSSCYHRNHGRRRA